MYYYSVLNADVTTISPGILAASRSSPTVMLAHALPSSDAGLAEITAHEEREHARLDAAKKEFARLESDAKKSYVSKEEAAHAHERKEATSALGRFEREELPRMIEEGETALSAELQAINASAASQAPKVSAWLVDKLSSLAA